MIAIMLISLTALSVQANDDEEEEKVAVESVSEDPQEEKEDDEDYNDDVNNENDENDENKDPVDEPSAVSNIMAAEESINEDSVDVGTVSKSSKKGRYYNYDDYLASALDASDNGYDWNSEYSARKSTWNSIRHHRTQALSSSAHLMMIVRVFRHFYFIKSVVILSNRKKEEKSENAKVSISVSALCFKMLVRDIKLFSDLA